MVFRTLTTNKKILMVINPSSNLGVLYDYLQGFGFKVLIVNDGENALELVESFNPDIILLEVILPGIDGFDTCRRLKSMASTKDIPVLFITGQSNTLDKVRGFALGAVDYITKPIQSEEVLARLKTHLTIQNLQRSLAEKNARLEEEIAERETLIAELDAFSHTVAHDLKNPVGVTVSYAKFLKKYCTTMSQEELQQYSDTILRNGHKMVNIIDELLLLASTRKEEVAVSRINMGEIAEEVQHRLSFVIEEYKAEIVTPSEWPTAFGYGPWVEEVLTNYVSNAMKYGGQPPRVELGATVLGDGMVKFWVHDNGRGLTPKHQAKLFIPFTRLNQVRVQGHGLGLSIVQRIVEKLGGKVAVESEGIAGKGSIFSFTLPQFVETDELEESGVELE